MAASSGTGGKDAPVRASERCAGASSNMSTSDEASAAPGAPSQSTSMGNGCLLYTSPSPRD
eukprot:11171456-Alexandrium_andersonii.AAC.1